MEQRSESRSIACPERHLLEAIADGLETTDALRDHVRNCGHCQRALRQLREDNELLVELATAVRRSAAKATNSPVPVEIAGYKIRETIGRGGQGVVYRAVQLSTKRDVAIKVIREGPLTTSGELARFQREVEILARLDHPHIVKILDSGAAAGCRYFVMELIDGVPLDEYFEISVGGASSSTTGSAASSNSSRSHLARFAASELERRLHLFARVCEAVHGAHLRGVMHRDLKPANVLVDRAGDPHVLDFGLARNAVHGDETTLTREAHFVGTVRWASPEQTSGDPAQIDLRSDVYSLGLMLHNLLTGDFPYAVAGSLPDVIANIRSADPTPPGLRRRGISAELDTIVLKCLAKEPERRYESAGALARDVRHFLDGSPLDARRDSIWYVVRKRLSRHRRAVALTTVLGIASIAALLTGTYLAARAAEAVKREAIERSLRTEQTARAQAVALVLSEILPPVTNNVAAAPTASLEHSLIDLREALETGWLRDQPELVAQIQSILSDIYAARGTNSGWAGESAAYQARMLMGQLYGQQDPRTLRMAGVQVGALLARKRLVEAEHDAAALARSWDALGESWREQARMARVMLASAQLQQGRPGDAEATVAGVLGEYAAATVAPSVCCAWAWQTLSEIHEQQSDFKSAREACMQSLKIRLLLNRDTHPDVTSTIALLGRLTRQCGIAAATAELPAADDLLALASALGKCDSDPLGCGLSDAAEALIELKRTLFGEIHGEAAESMALLGLCFHRVADWPRSASWYERSGQVLEAHLGQPDLSVANCFALAAEAHGQLLDFDRRLQLEARVLLILERIPRGHIDPQSLALRRRDLATHYGLAGRCDQIDSLFTQVIDVFEAGYGVQGHVVATTHTRYADALLRCDRPEEALKHATIGYDLGVDLRSTPADQREAMMHILMLAYAASNRIDEAMAISTRYESLVALRRAQHAESDNSGMHAWLADVHWSLAAVHRAAGDVQRAAAYSSRSRDHWDCVCEQLQTRFGVEPQRKAPWNAYPAAALRDFEHR
ncbi:MAG: serine/threonine protein kinase [Phycisphaerae bacterium]